MFSSRKILRYMSTSKLPYAKLQFNFMSICELFDKVENTQGLTAKKKIYSNFLLNLITKLNEENKEEIFNHVGEIIKISIPYLNLIQNKSSFRDKQNSNEINLRYQYTFDMLIKNFIKFKFKISNETIQEEYVKQGDLAKYLFFLYKEEKFSESHQNLTISEVLEYKHNIITTIGNKSNDEKLIILNDLLDKCKNLHEVMYVVRIFLNKLKIGIAEKNIINIIIDTEIYFKTKKNYRELISYLEKNIFNYQIYYPMKLKQTDNLNNLELSLTPGVCVELQLGRHGMDLETFFSTIEKTTQTCVVETKYDGERSQMHFDGKELKLASRSSHDQSFLYQNLKTEIFNEIVNYNKNNYKNRIKNFIIDGEIVSYSHKLKKFCSFQELRKIENVNLSKDIEYIYIVFDLLYYNDVNIHKFKLEERKTLLKQFFYSKFKKIVVENGKWINLEILDIAKKEIKDYFNYAKSINCEGLVAKETGKTSIYQFGKRRWYKIKVLDNEVSDTLDLIPIAGYIGKGSDSSKMNSFLVSVYDKNLDQYIGLCKIGTGFDQKDLNEIQSRFLPHMLNSLPGNYILPVSHRPAFFFKPIEVWEVGYDSFSESLKYSFLKYKKEDEKGISLRFPRFIRVRRDKSINEASTPEEIEYQYNRMINKII
jgi:DNA ligase-1